MTTLADNITRNKAAWRGARDAVREMGASLPDGAAVETYADAIKSIDTGDHYPYTIFEGKATEAMPKDTPAYGLRAPGWDGHMDVMPLIDTIPPNTANGVAYNLDGAAPLLAVAHNSSPGMSLYTANIVSGLAKWANPSTLPAGNGIGVAISPGRDAVAVAHSSSPYVSLYDLIAGLVKAANPANLPTGAASGIAYSLIPGGPVPLDGDMLAVTYNVSSSTSYVAVYTTRNGAFLDRIANLTVTTDTSATATGVAFAPSGGLMTVSQTITPFVSTWQVVGTTFTKLGNPASLPAGAGNAVAYSPDGKYMAVAHTTSPFVTIYRVEGTTFTKLPNPAALPAGIGRGVAFSPDGRFLAVAHTTTPFVTVYQISEGDVFTKLANPAVLPAGIGYSVAFSPDGQLLTVGHATTPFVTTYQTLIEDRVARLEAVRDVARLGALSNQRVFAGMGFLAEDAAPGETAQLKVMFA